MVHKYPHGRNPVGGSGEKLELDLRENFLLVPVF